MIYRLILIVECCGVFCYVARNSGPISRVEDNSGIQGCFNIKGVHKLLLAFTNPRYGL